jgi:hypothetical protein
MSWLIFVAIGLSLFGSVYWLKPSARDTRLAKLRFDAIKLGLQVRQFTFKPDSAKTGVREDVTATSYTLMLDVKGQSELLYRVVGQPAWDSDGLPEGLSWHNKGSAEDAEKIRTAVEQLHDSILLLEVFSNRIVLMPAEGKEATAENYMAFLKLLA